MNLKGVGIFFILIVVVQGMTVRSFAQDNDQPTTATEYSHDGGAVEASVAGVRDRPGRAESGGDHAESHDLAMSSAAQTASVVANASQVISNAIQFFILSITVFGILAGIIGGFALPRYVRASVDRAVIQVASKVRSDIADVASDAVADVSEAVAREHAQILTIYTEIVGALERETSNALANAITNNQEILKSIIDDKSFIADDEKRSDTLKKFADFEYHQMGINEAIVQNLLGIISPSEARNKEALEKVLKHLNNVPPKIGERILELLDKVEKARYFGPNDVQSLAKIKMAVRKRRNPSGN